MSDFRQQALDYHSKPVPGKISIALTKPAESVEKLQPTPILLINTPAKEI